MKGNFLRETQQEIKRVTWTTKEELISLTKIVLGATFMFGIAVYIADLIIRGCLDTIGQFVRWIFG
jgi:preprotein translocase subunit SecE